MDVKDQSARGIVFYEADRAPLLDDDGMMTPPDLDASVYTSLDLSPLAAGSKVTVHAALANHDRWVDTKPA